MALDSRPQESTGNASVRDMRSGKTEGLQALDTVISHATAGVKQECSHSVREEDFGGLLGQGSLWRPHRQGITWRNY